MKRIIDKTFVVRAPLEVAWNHFAEIENWPSWANSLIRENFHITPLAHARGVARIAAPEVHPQFYRHVAWGVPAPAQTKPVGEWLEMTCRPVFSGERGNFFGSSAESLGKKRPPGKKEIAHPVQILYWVL